MPAYIISDVGPVAPEAEDAWKAYLERAPAAIAQYGGRYLARGGTIAVFEGDWSPNAIVLVEFPDMDAVKRWYASPEYAEALRIREGKLHRKLIAVEGTDGGAAGLLNAKVMVQDDR